MLNILTVLLVMRDELETTMKLVGITSLDQVSHFNAS